MLVAETWLGVGNFLPGGVVMVVVVASSSVLPAWCCSWLNSATKRALMAFAAAPDTCWEIMPDASDSKGSIFSARPSGEKTRQWWASMSGLRRGLTVMGNGGSARLLGMWTASGGKIKSVAPLPPMCSIGASTSTSTTHP